MTPNTHGFIVELSGLCKEYGLSYEDLKDSVHYNRETIEFQLVEGEQSIPPIDMEELDRKVKSGEIKFEPYTVKAGCIEVAGGCGAEVLGDSREEAIKRWNTRITDRNMEGAVEFIRAILMNKPIWPNSWGQDVAAAAYFLTTKGYNTK